MKITTTENGILQIDNAEIMFRNFKGRPSLFNREGDRNFAVLIPDGDIFNELYSIGWNVYDHRGDKNKPSYLPVKVRFHKKRPNIYVELKNSECFRITEGISWILDEINSDVISSVSLDIKPYIYDVDGKYRNFAYLFGMKITTNMDRIDFKALCAKHCIIQLEIGRSEGIYE